MKKRVDDGSDDLYICKGKILSILSEYNCAIETDDYHAAWLRDLDTQETTGLERRGR